MLDYQKEFIQHAIDCKALKFGDFQLKSGRISPYFFNTGLFNSGAKLARLGYFYSQALAASNIAVDMLYGPAYKGIPLVTATACAHCKINPAIGFAFNRKETKDHGEGGLLMGAPLQGKVVIVDDVISSGISVSESVAIIRQTGAEPCGVLIALDRQERGNGNLGAAQEVRAKFAIPVVAIVQLDDIVEFLQQDAGMHAPLAAIEGYRQQWG